MHILVVEPYRKPYELEIPDTLEAKQHVVGGYIEAAYPFQEDAVVLICNEEGAYSNIPLNRLILPNNQPENWEKRLMRDTDMAIFGTFFLCGDGGENFTNLSPELTEKYKKKFARAHDFLKVNGKVIVIASKADPAPAVQKVSKRGKGQSR